MEERENLKTEWANKKATKKQMLDIFTKEKPSIHEIELAIKNAEEVYIYFFILN